MYQIIAHIGIFVCSAFNQSTGLNFYYCKANVVNQGPEYCNAVLWPNSISIWFTFQKSWTFGPVVIRCGQAG